MSTLVLPRGLRPPSNSRLSLLLRWAGGECSLNPRARAHMAERSPVVAAARVTRAECADRSAKTEAGP